MSDAAPAVEWERLAVLRDLCEQWKALMVTVIPEYITMGELLARGDALPSSIDPAHSSALLELLDETRMILAMGT